MSFQPIIYPWKPCYGTSRANFIKKEQMSRKANKRHLGRKNRKYAQLSAPRSDLGTDYLLRSIAKAQSDVEAGQIHQAIAILTDDLINGISNAFCKDSPRTDIILAVAELFRKTGQFDQAQLWYDKVLEHGPDGQTYNALGNLFYDQGSILQAEQYYRKAVETEPDRPDFCANFARAMMSVGKVSEAIDLLAKVVEKMPENPQVYSNYLFRLHQLSSIDQQSLFEHHKRWAQIHAPVTRAKTDHDNNPDPDRRLRVGYISPDFRSHSVAYFFESLLDGHDRNAIELYGYGNVAMPDEVTERLKGKFDHYKNIRGVDQPDVAELIERDKIDILVDLAGHIGQIALPALSYKPAPVQVTYLGYPDTTGMQQIDYRFTDALADPPQSQKFHTEELVNLPQGFLCYRPFEFAPSVSRLPAQQKGYVTFGSFNNSCKINPLVIELWSEVLKLQNNSRLMLKIKSGDQKQVREYYLDQFEQNGIDPERIEIFGWMSMAEHFKLYQRMDIALDTYPYNGTTTTCEALWMGVPVVSLAGDHHVSRVGLSILTRIGMGSLCARNKQQYIVKAVSLASKIDALAKIRLAMRARIATSGLCSAKNFARDVENAYRQMWHRWCITRSDKPKLIEVQSRV